MAVPKTKLCVRDSIIVRLAYFWRQTQTERERKENVLLHINRFAVFIHARYLFTLFTICISQ